MNRDKLKKLALEQTPKVVAYGMKCGGFEVKVHFSGFAVSLLKTGEDGIRYFRNSETLVKYLEECGLQTFKVDITNWNRNMNFDSVSYQNSHPSRRKA